MGVFSSKIIAGVIAGGFTLSGAGLMFAGTDQLQDASQYVRDTTAKITQYEVSENSLLRKIGFVQSEANGKIDDANEVITDKNTEIAEKVKMITDLSGKKAQLELQVASLSTEIDGLEASLLQSNTDHDATKALLATKTTQYDAKVAELQTANDTIAEYIRLAQIAYAKAQEADRHIADLEAQMNKANTEVNNHDVVVDQAKVDTEGKVPMTNEELDGVDTSTEEVVEEPVEAPTE